MHTRRLWRSDRRAPALQSRMERRRRVGTYQRGHAEVRGVVDASPEDVWELLTDWAGFERWWVKPSEGGRPGPELAKVELVHPADQIPRTRIVHHVTGSAVDETLLLQDDETRRIYYNMIFRPNPGGAV